MLLISLTDVEFGYSDVPCLQDARSRYFQVNLLLYRSQWRFQVNIAQAGTRIATAMERECYCLLTIQKERSLRRLCIAANFRLQ